MLITVTTASQDLETILSAGQENVALANIDWKNVDGFKEYEVSIQVLGAQDVYIDFWQASAITTWYKMVTWDILKFKDVRLSDCNLISQTANNIDVRVLIN